MADPNPNPPTQITEADLKAAIEKARQEEKAKLYPDLEAARKQADEAQKLKDSQEAELKKLRDQLEVVTKSSAANGTLDVAKLVEEVTAKAKAMSAEQLQQIEARQRMVEEENKKLRLERLQERLIQEAGGPDKLVTALVGGASEEQLRQSVQLARQAYIDTENRIKAQLAQSAASGNGGGHLPVLPPNAAASGGQSSPQAELAGIRRLSPEDYAKQRKEALAKAAQLGRQSQGGVLHV